MSIRMCKDANGICLVDALGLPLSVYVTPADMHDTQGARRLLAGLKFFVPRLTHFWAGAAYCGQELAEWCKAQGDWDLQVVERTAGMRGFRVQPKRWGVERTFGWLARNRRMNNYYERDVQTSETLIEVAMIRLLLARLGRGRRCSPTRSRPDRWLPRGVVIGNLGAQARRALAFESRQSMASSLRRG